MLSVSDHWEAPRNDHFTPAENFIVLVGWLGDKDISWAIGRWVGTDEGWEYSEYPFGDEWTRCDDPDFWFQLPETHPWEMIDWTELGYVRHTTG